MSKLLKFIIILSVLFIVVFNCSYTCFALDLNNSVNTTNTNTNSSNTSSSTLSSTVTTSDFDLQLTNILCIALIVVGVLLILLGIAILIRLKN